MISFKSLNVNYNFFGKVSIFHVFSLFEFKTKKPILDTFVAYKLLLQKSASS